MRRGHREVVVEVVLPLPVLRLGSRGLFRKTIWTFRPYLSPPSLSPSLAHQTNSDRHHLYPASEGELDPLSLLLATAAAAAAD